MKVLDLFSGIGGFSLGLGRCGMQTVAFCEVDKKCQIVLKKYWPNVPVIKNIKEIIGNDSLQTIIAPVHLIAGGDPCPIRSKAKGNRKSKYPDLAGYFLALVGQMRPGWVVRENVPAPDDHDFTTCLEMLGYRTIVIRTNSFPITAQNRTRDYIVGCDNYKRFSRFCRVLERQSGDWLDTKGNTQAEGYPCLTTHRKRYDSRDGFIWNGKIFRVADKDERTKLAGFPSGWLAGFSETACARMLGNAVIPQVVELIGKAINVHSKRSVN